MFTRTGLVLPFLLLPIYPNPNPTRLFVLADVNSHAYIPNLSCDVVKQVLVGLSHGIGKKTTQTGVDQASAPRPSFSGSYLVRAAALFLI